MDHVYVLEIFRFLATFAAFFATGTFILAYHFISRKQVPWYASPTGRLLMTKAFGIFLLTISSVLARIDELDPGINIRNELGPFMIAGYTVIAITYVFWFKGLLELSRKEFDDE